MARAIAKEERERNPGQSHRDNNFARIIKNAGFDSIKGLGGNLAFSTSHHELLHKTFVYAPPVKAAGDLKYPKSAAILDFVNHDQRPLLPQNWTPKNAASYMTFTWNLERALNNIHYVVDDLAKKDAVKNALEVIKEQNGIDMRVLIKQFDNQVTMISETEQPITIESEQIVIALKIKEKPVDGKQNPTALVADAISKFFGENVKIDTFGKHKIYSEEIIADDLEIEGDDWFDDEEEVEEGEELFDQRFLVVVGNDLLVSNNLEYLKRVIGNIEQKPGEAFRSAPDFIRVSAELNKLVDPNKVSLRQFGRIDRTFEANYEMFRQGKMRSSKTLLAKIIEMMRQEEEIDNDETPQQKIDASDLPEFKTAVAPYLGPSGWVVETEEEGWRITGCILQKQPQQVAKKKATMTK